MAQPAQDTQLTVEEYLEFEQSSQVRHEYVGGRILEMAGASDDHGRIALNIASFILGATRGRGCRTYQSDMKVRIGPVFYYPDVLVTCEPGDTEPYFKTSPCLIVEVLSESTEAVDRGEKLYNYRRLESLETYVLAHQDKRRLEVYRREAGGRWAYEVLEGEDVLGLPCPALELGSDDVYREF